MATQFRSVGAAFGTSFLEQLAARGRERRQASLDKLLVAAQMKEQERQQKALERQAELDRRAEERYQRDLARVEAAERAAASAEANERGLRQMTADALRQGADPRDVALQSYGETGEIPDFLQDAFKAPPAPKRHLVTTTDERGRPVQRVMTEDELATGVPVYREPKEPRAPAYQWITRNGQTMRVPESAIMPGDQPYNAQAGNGGTEGQRKTSGLLQRAQAARTVIDEVEGSVGAGELLAPNWMNSSDGQEYRQAARVWNMSVLRDESGAAITPAEEEAYFKTYFRQPGDSAKTIANKKRARDAAEAAMGMKAGAGAGGGRSGGAGNAGEWIDVGNGARVRRLN